MIEKKVLWTLKYQIEGESIDRTTFETAYTKEEAKLRARINLSKLYPNKTINFHV